MVAKDKWHLQGGPKSKPLASYQKIKVWK